MTTDPTEGKSTIHDTARPEGVSRSRAPLVVGGLLAIGAAAAATAVWQFGKSVDIPAARNDVPISTSPQTTQSSGDTESLADQQVTNASNEPEADRNIVKSLQTMSGRRNVVRHFLIVRGS